MDSIELSEEKYREIKELINSVKNVIRPTSEEIRKAYEVYDTLKELIESALSDLKHEFKVDLEGSLAKGTGIRGELDLDIFILIRYDKINSMWLERYVIWPIENRLRKIRNVRVVKRYASHPYIEVNYEGIKADIVPAYLANSISEIKTPVDRTPFHKEYVLSKLTSEELRDEVRLLKKFFKGIGVYGAEIKVEGFSGYLCELLIIKYSSFIDTLINMSRWKPQVVLYLDRPNISISELRRLFKESPLIFIDPVDPRRNAAASVSIKSLNTAILASSLFLLEPAKDFFFPRRFKVDYECMKKILKESSRCVTFLYLEVEKEVSPDILWGELKRLARRVSSLLTTHDFNLNKVDLWSDDESVAVIAIDTIQCVLPKYKLHEGPPAYKLPNNISFVSKYLRDREAIGPWVGDNGKLYVVKKRKFSNISDLISNFRNTLNTKHIKLRCMFNIDSIPSSLRGNEDFNYWLTELTLGVPPWLPKRLVYGKEWECPLK